MKFRLFLLTFFCTAGFLGAAGVGKISFLDGDVQILRNGKTLGPELDLGSEIENYDTVSTGGKSQAEITFNPATGVSGVLKLSANTSFYLELSALKKEQVAGIELLAGTISVKVDKMVGKTGLEVRTENSVMGARGTSFKIITTPAGDFLVSTEEGKVECQSGGRSLYSEPGAVIEVLQTENQFRSVPVSLTTLDSYETQWLSDRIQAFKVNAPRAFKFFSRRYQEKFSELQRGYERIQREGKKVVELWKKQDADGTQSAARDVIAEKNLLKGPLISIRRPLFFLERYYFRVKEMRPYVTDGSLPETLELSRGYTVKDFYRQLDKDDVQVQLWMAEVRYLMKLYSNRNEGSFPTNFVSSDFTSSSDFFN